LTCYTASTKRAPRALLVPPRDRTVGVYPFHSWVVISWRRRPSTLEVLATVLPAVSPAAGHMIFGAPPWCMTCPRTLNRAWAGLGRSSPLSPHEPLSMFRHMPRAALTGWQSQGDVSPLAAEIPHPPCHTPSRRMLRRASSPWHPRVTSSLPHTCHGVH